MSEMSVTSKRSKPDEGLRCILFDIVPNILLRLPVKALCRFKSVSKDWYLLINSKRFVKLHLQHTNSIEHTPSNLQVIYNISPNFMEILDIKIESLVEGIRKEGDPKPYIGSLPTINGCDKPIGSCNGIVCFRNMEGCRFLLLNPATRNYYNLPILCDAKNLHSYLTPAVHWYGFGYDTVGDDYKVVKITQPNINLGCIVIKVYSWREKIWKSHNCSTNNSSSYRLASSDNCFASFNGTLFDNALHWFVCSTTNDSPTMKCDQIASFDLSKEEFRLPVPLPETGLEYCTMTAPCNGTDLVLITRSKGQNNVWIMKEQGGTMWCKLAGRSPCILLFGYMTHDYGRRVLLLSELGSKLNSNNFLLFLDLGNEPRRLIAVPCSVYVSQPYVESLVNLNIDDGLQHIEKWKRGQATSGKFSSRENEIDA